MTENKLIHIYLQNLILLFVDNVDKLVENLYLQVLLIILTFDKYVDIY